MLWSGNCQPLLDVLLFYRRKKQPTTFFRFIMYLCLSPGCYVFKHLYFCDFVFSVSCLTDCADCGTHSTDPVDSTYRVVDVNCDTCVDGKFVLSIDFGFCMSNQNI